ncbi:MAG: hypothetical protein JSV66_00220, partial [Trueperaceae bacterium]
EARLDLACRARAELKLGRVAEGVGVGLCKMRLERRYQPVQAGGVIHVHQELGIGAVELLGRVGEQEAQAPLSDEGGLKLFATITDPTTTLKASLIGKIDRAGQLGKELAEDMLEQLAAAN